MGKGNIVLIDGIMLQQLPIACNLILSYITHMLQKSIVFRVLMKGDSITDKNRL